MLTILSQGTSSPVTSSCPISVSGFLPCLPHLRCPSSVSLSSLFMHPPTPSGHMALVLRPAPPLPRRPPVLARIWGGMESTALPFMLINRELQPGLSGGCFLCSYPCTGGGVSFRSHSPLGLMPWLPLACRQRIHNRRAFPTWPRRHGSYCTSS